MSSTAFPDSLTVKISKLLLWLWFGMAIVSSCVLIGQLAGGYLSFSVIVAFLALAFLVWRGKLIGAGIVVVALSGVAGFWYANLTPRNDRDWFVDMSILPQAELTDSRIVANNVRDFRWNTESQYEANWEQLTYELDALDSLDLVVEPFDDSKYAAHVMLSFGFSDGRRLVVSVEARKEKGEEYGLFAGAARQFELIYVFATEEDIVDLRARVRGSRVYSYPVRVDNAFARRLLLDLCESANALHERPQFYATLRHNCTTTLLDHADRILEKKIGWSSEILFPAKSGELLHRIGLMDTELSFDEAMVRFRIDEVARALESKENYSTEIRKK